MPRVQTSSVWQWFVKTTDMYDRVQVVCTFVGCHKKFKWHGSTTGMIAHLRVKHPFTLTNPQVNPPKPRQPKHNAIKAWAPGDQKRVKSEQHEFQPQQPQQQPQLQPQQPPLQPQPLPPQSFPMELQQSPQQPQSLPPQFPMEPQNSDVTATSQCSSALATFGALPIPQPQVSDEISDIQCSLVMTSPQDDVTTDIHPRSEMFIREPLVSSTFMEGFNHLYEKIFNYLVDDMRPVALVSDPGFRAFVTSLGCDVVLPGESEMGEYLKLKHLNAKSSILFKLNSAIEEGARFAVSAHAWSYKVKGHCLTTRIHYVTSDWRRVTFNLGTAYLGGEKSRRQIENRVLGVLDSFNVQTSSLVAFVHDASDKSVASGEDVASRVASQTAPCVAQLLQFVVCRSLNASSEVSSAVETARNLVDRIKSGDDVSADDVSKEMSAHVTAAMTSATLDQLSGWVSVFHTIKYLVEYRHVISRLEASSCLTTPQWDLLEEIVALLKPFEAVASFLSLNSFAPISTCPILLSGLERFTRPFNFNLSPPALGNPRYCEATEAVRSSMHEILSARCLYDVGGFVTMAGALDPRFCKLKHLRKTERTQVHDALNTLCSPHFEQPDETKDGGQISSGVLDNLFGVTSGVWSDESDDEAAPINDEISRYFRIAVPGQTTDPLAWWRAKEGSFPVLAKLARGYLSVPAAVERSEVAFSPSGSDFVRSRSNIALEHLDSVLFLHENRFSIAT